MDSDEHIWQHDELEVWRLLPWLANGTLEDGELERVLRHLEVSPTCREELLFLSELRCAVELTSDDRFEPSTRRLQRLMERIEAHEKAHEYETTVVRANDAGCTDAGGPRATESVGSRRAVVGPRTTQQAWSLWTGWAVAAAATLFAIGLLWRLGADVPTREQAQQPAFRTLSEPAGSGRKQSPMSTGELRVIFEEEVAEASLRALLLDHELEIVSGPTLMGVYSLRRSPGGSGLLPARVVTELRADERITFVEAVHYE